MPSDTIETDEDIEDIWNALRECVSDREAFRRQLAGNATFLTAEEIDCVANEMVDMGLRPLDLWKDTDLPEVAEIIDAEVADFLEACGVEL